MGDLSQARRWSISKSTSRCLYTLPFFPFLEITNVNGGVASNYNNARIKDARDADNIKSDLKDQTPIKFSRSLNLHDLIVHVSLTLIQLSKNLF